MIKKHEFDSFFNRMVEESQFSAEVLVAVRNGIVQKGGYGQANHSRGTSATPETIFDVGSISKQFTATDVLKIESQGLLNINNSIDKYLVSIPEDKAEITIPHLLTHTAEFVEEQSKDDLAPQNREEFSRSYYGYGWTLQETPFGDLITHNGGGIDGNSTKIDLLATKARTKLAYELFS